MTEKSYFHNGTAAGDALEAPYDQNEFADLVQASFANGMFVLPNQLNNFPATPGVLRRINIGTGRALINGFWYENDATVTVTIGSNSTSYNRIDAIVVEIDTEAGAGEIKVLQGIPEELPSPPPLNTCETLLQMPLYYVAAVTGGPVTIDAKYIYDQRRFMDNVYHRNYHTRQNDFPNGLFIAWCDSENSGTSRRPMPGWKFNGVGTPQSVKDAERFDGMVWGRCVQYYTAPSDSTEGFEITVLTDENASQEFTLSFTLQVNDGYTTVAFGGNSLDYIASDTPYQVIIRDSLTGYHTLSISGTASSAKFGDFRLAQGFCIAQQTSNGPEIVMFDEPVYMNRTVNNSPPVTLAGLSTGLVSGIYMDMFGATEDFYPSTTYQVKGLIFQMRVNDSGSAGSNDIYGGLYFYGGLTTLYQLRVDVGGVANDEPRYSTGIMWNDQETNLRGLGVYANATGAGTLDIDLSIVGVIL